VADQKRQVSTPLFENILAQPDALQSVLDAHSSEGFSSLTRSAAVLRNSRKIILTGMGASLFACGPLRYLLAKNGASISLVESAELLHFLPAIFDAETSVVLVSRSGESIEVIKLLDILEGRGSQTVGVANVADSTLLSRTTESILLRSPADQLVAVQTYIATAVSLLLLGAAYLGELESAAPELRSAIDLLRTYIPECVEASQHWKDFIGWNSPVYVLGRGPSLASVEEGVLLMHETAKSPAVGMSIAQFRHGPVEAADENMRAVLIGTQSGTASYDRQLAADLMQMGADVRWIGPLDDNSGIKALAPWPAKVPALFQSIFEVTPLQLLAYRTAEARGITPGDFRWAPTITSSESGFPGLKQSAIT
jgi:glucosamine--fructose-6-phosphate aminotransferase (isomerizing)